MLGILLPERHSAGNREAQTDALRDESLHGQDRRHVEPRLPSGHLRGKRKLADDATPAERNVFLDQKWGLRVKYIQRSTCNVEKKLRS